MQTIRSAKPSDLDKLKQISREVINKHYRSFLGDEQVDAFIGSGMSDAYIEDMLDNTIVLVVDGVIAAICAIRENLIDLIMVNNEFHRHGFGTALMTHVEKELFQTFDEIQLESFEGNYKANAFYAKNGWMQVKREYDESAAQYRIYYRKLKP